MSIGQKVPVLQFMKFIVKSVYVSKQYAHIGNFAPLFELKLRSYPR